MKKRWLWQLIVLMGITAFLWGFFFEPGMITVTRLTFPVEKWKGMDKEMNVVLAGDIHAAPGEHERLARIVKHIRKLQPDVILLLGDYCKGATEKTTMNPAEIGELLAPLAEVAPVYAVMGNHDAYCGERKLRIALEKAGITLLDNEAVMHSTKGVKVQFSGIMDANTNDVADHHIPDRMEERTPVVLLSHTPDIMPILDRKKADLTVAGHTHGGQICLPGGFPIKTSSQFGRRYAYGVMEENGKHLIVTRGLGTSLLPMRIFCPPEVMLLTLQASKR